VFFVISGIVLAAGASTRMGQAKASLPLGQMGETVLSRVVRTLVEGGVPEIVVVAGAHIDAVRAAMPRHETRARVIENTGWQRGQLSSLVSGLDAIDTPSSKRLSSRSSTCRWYMRPPLPR
jgi:molybdenum cofactor cytidylyltransferase